MNHDLTGVGRYTDEFYPTAVGDYLMSQGIPNILIESGVAKGDLDRTKHVNLVFRSFLNR